jgi:hypothetical protein
MTKKYTKKQIVKKHSAHERSFVCAHERSKGAQLSAHDQKIHEKTNRKKNTALMSAQRALN